MFFIICIHLFTLGYKHELWVTGYVSQPQDYTQTTAAPKMDDDKNNNNKNNINNKFIHESEKEEIVSLC